MSDREIKLKPCPFCGGKPYSFVEEQTTVLSEPYTRAVVRCTNCEARIQYVIDGYIKPSVVLTKAIEKWNRRAEPTQEETIEGIARFVAKKDWNRRTNDERA